MAARALIILLSALILSIATALIVMGTRFHLGLLILGVFVSSGLGIILGLTIGGLTDSQISAIAAVKIVMIAMTGIPMASLAIPSTLNRALYPFPNYWVFQMFQNVFTGGAYGLGFWKSCLLTGVTSAGFLLILVPVIGRKLRLR